MTLQNGTLQTYPMPSATTPPPQDSTLSVLLRTSDMVTLNDAAQSSVVPTLDTTHRSVMTVPLFARGVIVAVLEISSRQAYAFADTDAVVFRQLATQLSIALENAQAYTQSQRIAKSKALVNEISSKMQQQQKFEDVLNVTIEELGRALGARKGRIRLGKADTK